MKYILFNKNVPAVSLEIDEGYIEKVYEVFNADVLPIMAKYNKSIKNGIREWLEDRSIPTSRVKDKGYPVKLSIQNLGLSLSDQYWFCPEGSELIYDKVNLFENPFYKRYYGSERSFSPDFSSNGQQDKHWEIRGEKRVLIKKSRKPFYQEAANEVFADRLLEKLGVPHIRYTMEKGNSVCETGVTPNTEYVPATHIFYAFKKANNDSNYTHLLKCIDKLKIPVTQQEIDNMVVFDHFIDNTDRNFGNFGFLREAEGGKFIGMFPLFDHGNSMWYQEPDNKILSANQTVKPFNENPLKQLGYVKKITLPLNRLTEDFLKGTVAEVYKDVLEPKRIEVISEALIERIEEIKERFTVKRISLCSKRTGGPNDGNGGGPSGGRP